MGEAVPPEDQVSIPFGSGLVSLIVCFWWGAIMGEVRYDVQPRATAIWKLACISKSDGHMEIG